MDAVQSDFALDIEDLIIDKDGFLNAELFNAMVDEVGADVTADDFEDDRWLDDFDWRDDISEDSIWD